MEVNIFLAPQPKNRSPRWACRIEDKGKVIFDSQWISIRFHTQDAIKWLTDLMVALLEDEKYSRPLGPEVQKNNFLTWQGDLNDDCKTSLDGLTAHAEWLSGPHKGGVWYCAVISLEHNLRYFHTMDFRIEPRSGSAARWLCELVISAVLLGHLDGYDA